MSEQQSEAQKQPDMNDPIVRKQLYIMTAMRAALSEFIDENRGEVIKRARAKLVALGVEFSDEDLGA